MFPGEIVTTGRALDREAAASHALEVQASDGQLASTARVSVRLLDVNDHAPVFAQRFYDIRVPAPLAPLSLPQVITQCLFTTSYVHATFYYCLVWSELNKVKTLFLRCNYAAFLTIILLCKFCCVCGVVVCNGVVQFSGRRGERRCRSTCRRRDQHRMGNRR